MPGSLHGQGQGWRAGIAALVCACTIWGLAPIYYKAMHGIAPLEILAHRTVWSMVIFALYLGWQRRLGEVARLITGRARWLVVLGAVMIAANWFVFIWSIQTGRAVEASLGYYIFPLIAVVLGRFMFAERLVATQALAIWLAVLAVAILTFGLGVAPWVALFLAVSFAIYAALKRHLPAGPVASVTAEVALMLPLALVWLVWLGWNGQGHFGRELVDSLMLIGTGAITGIPLMLFSFASRRASMAAFGLTQYLNPTLQFLCATLIFNEPFSGWHLMAFGLIWIAVAVFAFGAVRQARAAASAASSSATSAATPT